MLDGDVLDSMCAAYDLLTSAAFVTQEMLSNSSYLGDSTAYVYEDQEIFVRSFRQPILLAQQKPA